MRTQPWVLVGVCLLFLVPLPALAQRATLAGTVTDQSGAVVPGVDVTLSNLQQGLKREVHTSDSGYFAFPLLQPGTYNLTAQLTGFAPHEVKGLILNVGDEIAVRIKLELANVGESVEVLAEPARISTSAAVSTVVDRNFVENMPLNGRSFQTLINLTPGVVLAKATLSNTGQFTVNGQRANANNFLVDGVSANIGASAFTSLGQAGAGTVPATASTGGINNLVSIDALEEFQIQTSSYAPEFGRMPGAQVSLITRSGTNEFHGSLFEYFRDAALDARDWFANRAGLTKPKTRQHDYGAAIGGPIIRDRTFFFFSYERLDLRQPQTGMVSLPTLAVRQGLPAAIRPYVDAFPIPNGADLGGGLGVFSASYTNPTILDAVSLRVDHRIGESITLFGRYNRSRSEAVQRTGSLSALTRTPFDTDTATVGATFVAGSRLSDDLRVNYSRSTAGSFFEVDSLGGAQPPPDALLFPSGVGRDEGLFSFNIGPFYNVGKSVKNLQVQWNVVDTLSAVRGQHHLKLGFDYRRLTPFNGQRTYSQSVAFAAGGIPALQNAIAPSVSISATNPGEMLFENLSVYIQDTWRLTPRASLTYGLRWELNPPPEARNGTVIGVVTGIDNPRSIALAPPETPLWATTYDNLAPRVGLTFELSPRTVLRGGGGLFFDTGAGMAANVTGAWPNVVQRTFVNAAFPLQAAQLAPPVLNPADPIALIIAPDPKLRLPVTYQWNIAVEQALGRSQSLSLTYVGAAGRRLLRSENLVNPNPRFLQVRPIRNAGESDYNALQLRLQRRLANGLQALASYTWSKCEDLASDDSTLFAPVATVSSETERGPCDFDVRHSVSAAASYDIPSPAASGVLGALRDWSLDALLLARSAYPFSVNSPRDLGFGSINYRPDLVPGVPLYIEDPSAAGGRRLNRAAFIVPSELRQGTLGRNALRGFGMWQVDVTVRRNVRFSERLKLQLRAEMFNVFNHPNFGDPVGSLTSGLFGQSTQSLAGSLGSGGLSGGFNPLYQVGGPRSIQLAARLIF